MCKKKKKKIRENYNTNIGIIEYIITKKGAIGQQRNRVKVDMLKIKIKDILKLRI